jgi:hypothetical protein
MSIPFLNNLDLNQNELQNVRIQNLAADPGSPVTGQIWFNTTTNQLKLYDGTAVRVIAELSNSLEQFAVPATDLSINSHKLTNVADPTTATDAATKGYVDAVAIGLDVKESCRAASTANVDIATGLQNGSAIDGVTLATGDRVLLKNQTNAAENGIYVVAAGGAASRSADCNSSANYTTGAFTFIEEGTTNQGYAFVVNTQGAIVVGTTAVSWVRFAGGVGGSVNKYATTIGDGATTSFAVAHNLGTTDVDVAIQETGGNKRFIQTEVRITDANTVTMIFATAPVVGAYRVVVEG